MYRMTHRIHLLLLTLQGYWDRGRIRLVIGLVNILPDGKFSHGLVTWIGRLQGKRLGKIIEKATVRQIQEVGRSLEGEPGTFLVRNAEKLVLFRVFKRWMGGS